METFSRGQRCGITSSLQFCNWIFLHLSTCSSQRCPTSTQKENLKTIFCLKKKSCCIYCLLFLQNKQQHKMAPQCHSYFLHILLFYFVFHSILMFLLILKRVPDFDILYLVSNMKFHLFSALSRYHSHTVFCALL